jgi:hypothetical protein
LKRARELWSRRFRVFGGVGRGEGSGTGADGHPTPELLSAYHDDRLPPETDGEIQEHFVECPECPELVLDLDRFTSPEAARAAEEDLSDTWVDAAWRRLRSRLITDPRPVRPRLRWLAGPVPAWSLAALLLPCTIVLWIQVAALGGQVRDLEAPQLNPPWREVEAPGVLRGGEPPPWEVEVPAGARQFLLIFHPSIAPRPASREYRLEIRDGQGQDIWSGHGLRQSEEGSFVIGVSRRFLPPGDYRFLVIVADPEEEEKLEEEFPLRLKYL